MIRREVVVGAALASACFVAGQLRSSDAPPEERAFAPMPDTVPDCPPAEAAQGPPSMYMTWPHQPSLSPELVWPPSGCDAGMWSVRYEILEIDATHTRIEPVAAQDPNIGSTLELEHVAGADVSFYPVSPEHAWVLVTDPETGHGELMRTHREEVLCRARIVGGDSATQVRGDASSATGIRVFARDSREFRGAEYDDDCTLIGHTVLDASMLSPAPVTLRSAPSQTMEDAVPLVRHAVQGTRMMLSHGQRYSGASVTFEAESDIDKFLLTYLDGHVIVAFVDEGSTYVRVLDNDLNELWSERLANEQPWQDPITGIAYVDGFLALRGGLDAGAWNAGNEWIRIWDTNADEVVGEIVPAVLNEAVGELTWTWPDSSPHPLTACLGGGGLFGGCDGEVLEMDWRWEDKTHFVAQITRDWGEGPTVCSKTVEVDSIIELRGRRSPEHALTVYGMSDERLLGWTFGLDCVVRETVDLPRSVLDSYPAEAGAAGLISRHCARGLGSLPIDEDPAECALGVTTRMRATENGHVVGSWTSRTLKLYLAVGLAGPWAEIDVPLNQPLDDVITGLAWDGEFLTARGAFDSPPWTADRDRIRVYRASSSEVLVDVAAAAVESK